MRTLAKPGSTKSLRDTIGSPSNFDNDELLRKKEPSSIKPSFRCRLSHVVEKWWLWEVLSSIASFVSLLTVILLLYMHQGRPLPHWPYSITLNSFVAIFSTTLKSAMLVVSPPCCLAQVLEETASPNTCTAHMFVHRTSKMDLVQQSTTVAFRD